MTTAAVIGCGDVSVVHLEAIQAHADAQLVAVCDVDPAAVTRTAERYGVPGFPSHIDLLEAVRPDVVHIATPHDQHVQPALDSLAAGVNVVLEKPVAHVPSEAERLVAAAEQPGAPKIAVCFQNRYNATSQAAAALLADGELGRVIGGSGTVCWYRPPAYYQSRPWRGRVDRSGGGALINQAIHTVDLLQWLLGEVQEVRGQASRLALGDVVDVEDTASIVLDHAGGARSVFFATNAGAVDSPVTLEIVTEGAELFLRRDLTVRYADGRVEVIEERQATSSGRAYWGASHALLIDDFYARLADPEPFWIGPREAVKSLDILSRVYAGGILAPA
jgi:UDP-N-acetyl-2-amino-2-deoxyglucuronate dehydrogenase